MSEKEPGYPAPKPYKQAPEESASPHTIKQSGNRRRDSKRDTAHYSKRDTSHYLTYYQSSIADGRNDGSDLESTQSSRLIKRASGGSTSSSGYSSDSKMTDASKGAGSDTSSTTRLRPGVPSDGASDRRRMAIVQMDTVDESSPKHSSDLPPSNIRSRRGLPPNLAGLALVAPPDAAPNTYSHFTPPSTAPIAGDTNMQEVQRDGHHRSASEAVNMRKNATRDLTHETADRAPSCAVAPRVFVNAPIPPISQSRYQYSRPSSPHSGSEVLDQTQGLLSPPQGKPPMSQGDTQQPLILTPEIGEEKDIEARVAAPVVIHLEAAGPFRRRKSSARKPSPPSHTVSQPAPSTPSFPPNDTASYLYYQPGIHATAGPLPPPPRAMFNIDTSSPAPPRPPRLNSPISTRNRGDIEAVKQALQLPPEVSAALASRIQTTGPQSPKVETTSVDPNSNPKPSTDIDNSESASVKPAHRREGAFSPSSLATSDSDTAVSQTLPPTDVAPSTPKVVADVMHKSDKSPNDDVPPITIVRPLGYNGEQQRHGDMTDQTTPVSTKRMTLNNASLEHRSPSRSSLPMSHTGETPSPPPKSFRNSFTTNIKRFSSISRTPSTSSKSAHRSSAGTQHPSRTPSPSIPTQIPLPRRKVISQYPPAMFCAEISSKKTSLERCILYAQKINELYMYDSGLGDWTIETKLRANTNRPTVALSAHTFTPQPRHTSRASIISEASFPRRPDASTATDLSAKPHDLDHVAPPTLPYPSLVGQRLYPPRSTTSIASGTPPSSIRSLASSTPSTKSGGFFSSLGRKASLSSTRREKGGPPTPSTSSPSGARILTKNPPTQPAPRSINISNTPSVPGGPRAAPNHRILRSQTIMTTTSPFSSNSPPVDREEQLTRRPSLANIPQESVVDIVADPEFARQVDKLADLLPHADRDVLAGYLRRAGQDILAIGQYLEDEKNGTIKTND